MKIGAIILAAGAATRMEQAKMLLQFKHSNILSHILEEVQWIQPVAMTVVTGYYHEEIIGSRSIDESLICFNKNWSEGISTSIQVGLVNLLTKESDLDLIFIIMSDQPFLNSELMQEMINKKQISGKGIIAAKYDGIVGSPVLFHKTYFNDLSNLKGDKGAKQILQQNPEDLCTIDFELGALDIDTVCDYELLQKILNEKNADR